MSIHADYEEVVWIDRDFRLVDAESYERVYSTDDGLPLPRGYYVAHWPAGTPNPHFLDPRLRFEGPYLSRRAAEAAAMAHDPHVMQ
ncbi:MAG: hypothetical protein IT531_22645 [Burkholderiales bacterium]|nr:hypothetical protein [Burkholderiales bacterium]